jgi:hypothetical protein
MFFVLFCLIVEFVKSILVEYVFLSSPYMSTWVGFVDSIDRDFRKFVVHDLQLTISEPNCVLMSISINCGSKACNRCERGTNESSDRKDGSKSAVEQRLLPNEIDHGQMRSNSRVPSGSIMSQLDGSITSLDGFTCHCEQHRMHPMTISDQTMELM